MGSYEDTLPLDDTVVLDSPIIESGQLSNDMNTQVLDGCESAQQPHNQMDGVLEKDFAPDSEDEGENRNEAVTECSGTAGRISGRNGIGLLRRQQASAGYFRRLNKVKKHVLRSLDSSIGERSCEDSTATRTGLCNDYTFQENRVAVDSVVSWPLEQKPVLIYPVNTECSNMERESLKEQLFEGKVPSHESKYMDTGKDINYDCKLAESPRVAESQDKALRFVEDYLLVCDLDLHKDIPTRKLDMIKSPACLRSKGAQSLAMRLTVGSTATKLKAFDWAEKQIDEADNASLRILSKDSVDGLGGNKSGCVSVNQESSNVELHNEIYSLQSKEKLPGIFSTHNNLDIVSLSSNDTEKFGLNSGMCIAPDSMETEEELDAEISRQNVEKAEDLRLTPDELCIGLDTQMAAEAMEELVHSAPPKVDSSCFTHQCSNSILLESSDGVNNKSKSNVASQEVAFVDWKCKEKRSKTIKISTVQDKSFCWVAGKRYKNQRKNASQFQAGKNLMTKKVKADGFFNRKEKTTNRKSTAPSRITMQLEEYGITERCSLKESQKLAHVYSRRPKVTADGIRNDTPPKRPKISSSSCKSSLRKGVNEVETDATKGKENFHLDEADTTHSDLNPWVYPKGKRTRSVTPRHEISSSNRSLAIDNNPKECPLEEAVGKVAKLLVYNRRHKVSLGSSSNLAIDLSSPSTDSPVPGRQVTVPSESDAKKPSKQSGGTPDDDASINMKANLLSKENSRTLQVLEGNAKGRRLSSSHLSRSPLMKELTRLGYTDSLPDFLPKDSRRRRANEKVCVLFSQNLDTSTLKQQKKILARLGFPTASRASDATHFVADRFVRTRNMLEAIALGKPVVTHLWLEGCEQAGYTIDEKKYILRDEKKEKEIGFNMHVSLTRATQLPLLKGRRVLITPNVKPGVDVINSLIKAVQGEVVQNIQDSKTKNEVLILSSIEDCTFCLQYLQKGASIYDSELLLNGIVTQELEYERYRLFKDHKENKNNKG